jgi:SAM-dependent methyltransferase
MLHRRLALTPVASVAVVIDSGRGSTEALVVGDDFPSGFFARDDEADDTEFYSYPRYVTHIDDGAIDAVGALYEQLGVRGAVLDLMSSWVSHFRESPEALTVVGMNADELSANPQARSWVVHDLNANPSLPFDDDSFDHATCCVSVDYLTRPVDVFREVARVVRAGGLFVCTFSNRLFPTKAIRGWLLSESATHQRIVVEYFAAAGAYEPAFTRPCATPPGGDPLYAVWARVL